MDSSAKKKVLATLTTLASEIQVKLRHFPIDFQVDDRRLFAVWAQERTLPLSEM